METITELLNMEHKRGVHVPQISNNYCISFDYKEKYPNPVFLVSFKNINENDMRCVSGNSFVLNMI